ncbi:hypothetical protein AAFC00_003761 [Neodothiora populina]|uniref:Uncharacterized protein n=1 Tax=Neodothiora populina TaxID=2781224 RepID=A0ABR3PFR6_9PEZI
MADNMDVDMDIDLTVDPEIAALEAEALKIQALAAAPPPQNTSIDDEMPVEEDKSRPVPTKVNVRGLDNFTTQDIRQFASEHYSTAELQQRVEWIDDTSANIVYNTEAAAEEALRAFSDLSESIPEQLSPLQSRKAKSLSTHPETELEVRLATVGDVKAPRAHERSRFYLMNPDHDPRERRRDYDDRGRRGNGRRPERRRREEPQQKFDVSMYDDDAGEGAAEVEPRARRGREGYVPRDRDSYASRDQGGRGGRRRSEEEDLFASNSQGRLRDRSASPVRDGDGRFGFDEDQPMRRTARRRSNDPPARQRDLIADRGGNTAPKELFPAKASKSSALEGSLPANNGSTVESVPELVSPPKRNRELFPNKTSHSNHRRSDALDSEETNRARRSLADRITGGPNADTRAAAPNGFSIKGSAVESPGFSIRGASREVNPVVKELFPSKLGAGNTGREDLFADKLKGKPRRRAEDLF